MNEIILSAGAIGSPQLLMLSGIGQAKHLLAHKIRVIVDWPIVGQGMADNPLNVLFIPSPRPVEVSLIQIVGITRFDSYIETASGSNFGYDWALRMARAFGILANQTGQATTMSPEQRTRGAKAKADENMNPILNGTLQAGFFFKKVAGPFSSSYLKLRTKDPNDNPYVTFNYFKDP